MIFWLKLRLSLPEDDWLHFFPMLAGCRSGPQSRLLPNRKRVCTCPSDPPMQCRDFVIYIAVKPSLKRHTLGWQALVLRVGLRRRERIQDCSAIKGQQSDKWHWWRKFIGTQTSVPYQQPDNRHDWKFVLVIEIPQPILEQFCPLFIQIAQMCLILPRWGLILPRIPPPTPVLYSAVNMYIHKHLQPHPKTSLFLVWTWKWAKWTTVWATWTPTGKCFEK